MKEKINRMTLLVNSLDPTIRLFHNVGPFNKGVVFGCFLLTRFDG